MRKNTSSATSPYDNKNNEKNVNSLQDAHCPCYVEVRQITLHFFFKRRKPTESAHRQFLEPL